MTRIVWLTDIHLNFVESELVEQLLDEVLAAAPDAVLIGGDIGESQNVEKYLGRFAARVTCPIYFVLGNHDFYHGSVPVVREAIGQFCERHAKLSYLTRQEQAIELTPHVGLIGHDGWADARLGDYLGSDVFLSDYALIEELAGHYHLDRRPMLQRLGDEAAAYIRELLPKALVRYEHVHRSCSLRCPCNHADLRSGLTVATGFPLVGSKNKRDLASTSADEVKVHLAFAALPGLVVRIHTRIDVAHHVEVIVVDVDDFNRVLVCQLMRNRPANIGDFREVDRAFVMSMMELSGSNGWDEPRRIDIVRDFLFDHPHVVPLLFVQVGQSAFDRPRSLQRSQHLVIARRIESNGRTAGGERSENRNGVVPLLNPELVFFLILEVGTHWNRDGQKPKVGPLHADTASTTECCARQQQI
ncbi:MAG: metallophosphoesterase [Planctomycetia bacterium]|nr:metallophosphoesterase [Planctomycetia bacterium]